MSRKHMLLQDRLPPKLSAELNRWYLISASMAIIALATMTTIHLVTIIWTGELVEEIAQLPPSSPTSEPSVATSRLDPNLAKIAAAQETEKLQQRICEQQAKMLPLLEACCNGMPTEAQLTHLTIELDRRIIIKGYTSDQESVTSLVQTLYEHGYEQAERIDLATPGHQGDLTTFHIEATPRAQPPEGALAKERTTDASTTEERTQQAWHT